MPLIEIARAATEAEAREGLERWKARYPEAASLLEPNDVLVDSMRGRSTTWTRIRLNLRHVAEADRPPQEALEVDYDPWEGVEWPGSEPSAPGPGGRRLAELSPGAGLGLPVRATAGTSRRAGSDPFWIRSKATSQTRAGRTEPRPCPCPRTSGSALRARARPRSSPPPRADARSSRISRRSSALNDDVWPR